MLFYTIYFVYLKPSRIEDSKENQELKYISIVILAILAIFSFAFAL